MGNGVAADNFRFLVMPGSGGESAVPGWTPVPGPRTAVFSSRGGPSLFTIHYTLSSSDPLEAGDYYGNAHLSIEND